MYADVLQRLQSRIENIPGMIVDAPCGSGHMLSMYHENHDAERPLLGVDLSPQMVEITQRRLGAAAASQWRAVGSRCMGRTGAIDYGEHSDLIAIRHKSGDLQNILADIGFDKLLCEIKFDEDMAMDAVYIEASKNS